MTAETTTFLKGSKTVRFTATHLEGPTFTLRIASSELEDAVFNMENVFTFFMTAEQLKELADTINDFRFKQALKVVQ